MGLGRAPGGPAEASLALSHNYLEEVTKFPEKIDELLNFFNDSHQSSNPFSKISPTPLPEELPHVWLLGTSGKSAILAADKGMNYVFGHFMTDQDGPSIVKGYRKEVKQKFLEKRKTMLLLLLQ